MPKGQTVTLDGVLGPLLRFLDRRSPDARTMALGIIGKEVARMNARPKAKAAQKAKPKQAPAAPQAAANKAAQGLKTPAKKSHKKKKPQAPATQAGGGENSAGESRVG